MEERPVAIVTGASSGIGRETAMMLAEAGYELALVARRESVLREVGEMIEERHGLGATPLLLPLDVSDPSIPEDVVRRTEDEFGRIDVLANIAGNAPLLPIEQVTPDIWRQCIDTNLSAVVLMTAAVWPVFKRQKSGTVVNVSSLAAFDPFPGFAIYAASKVGVNMFTRCTASEGQRIGVKAFAVAPGAVETPMLRQAFNETMLPREKALAPTAVARVIVDCITGEPPCAPGETFQVPSP
ncbi:MAG: SDR family oxidoreductase [Phycisphaeraceae bacterium]